jgi:transposase InsO family protein
VILTAVAESQAQGARLRAACAAVGLSARTLERWRSDPGAEDGRHGPNHRPANALSDLEQARAAAVMTSPEYAGLSPKQLVPELADQGVYLASESTLYRIRQRLGFGARRRLVMPTHATRASAVHRATGPNQVWSWDITYLPTAVRGCFLYLYLIVDVWSRRVVGWEVCERESAENAAALIRRTCEQGGVDPKGLVLHSDNGKPMRGNTMVATLQWLGIVPSFSRPHVCNDNPYSEALFRTLKHTPVYPRLPFASLEAAQRWVQSFVSWYNGEHRHSAIRFVTPDQRHFGLEQDILARRNAVYERACRRHPERWSGATRNWNPVGLVVLNPEPQQREAA